MHIATVLHTLQGQTDADLITCITVDAPQPPHQGDTHHEGCEDDSHHRSRLHHRAWRWKVTEGVKQKVFSSAVESPSRRYSPLCCVSGPAGGGALSLLVLWPVGGFSSLCASELMDWVTTMGLYRVLISHWDGGQEEGLHVSYTATPRRFKYTVNVVGRFKQGSGQNTNIWFCCRCL